MLRVATGLASQTRQWKQRVGALVGVPALIRELGGDPARLLAAAGLPPDALHDPEERVPYAAVGVLLHDAALWTRCGHFGLLVGRMHHLHNLGLIGEVLRNSPTVGDALQALMVYQHLSSGGGLTFLLERAGTVDFGYAIYHPDMAGSGVIYDATLAAALNFMRDLCGPAWLPSEVFIPHAAPRDVSPYRSLFRVKLHFNAEVCALRFPEHWMHRAVEGANPALLALARRRADTCGKGELVEQVLRALRLLMLQGDHAGDDVARMLSMHRRTLNRRLKAERTTFRELLDQVRFDVARQLLADSEITLDDVAATLGYAGVSPFMRTFRRWAGTTPSRWRNTAMARHLLDVEECRHAQVAPALPFEHGNPSRHEFLCGHVGHATRWTMTVPQVVSSM
jgi:AraC-like DNA-binding protein